MRALLIVGLLLLLLGVVLLFVPIKRGVRHGFDAGPVSVGVTTVERERVNPAISAVLIAGGIVLMVAGSRSRK